MKKFMILNIRGENKIDFMWNVYEQMTITNRKPSQNNKTKYKFKAEQQ